MSSTATASTAERPATPDGFVKITEGEATILFPSSDEVFYNPVQVFNRDLSTCVITAFAEQYLNERSEKARKKLVRRLGEQKSDEPAANAAKGSDTDTSTATPTKPSSSSSSSSTTTATTTTTTAAAPPDASSSTFLQEHAAEHPRLAAWRGPQDAGFDRSEHGISVLEALAASGLRSIRYHKEIPTISRIVCNDFSEEAVQSIRRNVDYNHLDPHHHVIPNHGDACMVMHEHRSKGSKFDVVDLDPYGSASPFLDAAVQSVSSGGLLCITCTDMAVLCGNYPETCFAKYGSMPAKRQHCHEMGVRTLLALTSRLATRYGRYIHPLLSCSIDFYCRVFVRVFDGAAKAKEASTKMCQVFQCTGCQSFHVAPLGRTASTKKGGTKYTPGHALDIGSHCADCGRIYHMGGPFWSAPMHDGEFISKCLDHMSSNKGKYATETRMKGMLSLCKEELPTPLYYTVSGMASILHCQCPPHSDIRSAIVNAGYEVSPTHCTAQGIKTTAPPHVMWDIYRTWVRKNPVSEKVLSKDSPASKILKGAPTTEIDFTYNKAAQPRSKLDGLVRYPENPAPNWGPKARAGKRRPEEPKTASKRADHSS
ncbi:hypothetical protein PTSG_12138 [Salpingoeca rosetta]|uniref:tRNA (guanine(26)-N(2))-dimethyltransferase n=1 Tax=Salpingoeca rosetta (strain ATCC 50818 / BSB-021) TaxID=946362 RepID=F2U6S3_SALR5|nr:uncharacterized protein PTSG_12138 [Salpingoeca rosetta]EGD83555.1 hypothetical protein PTSG_12138 [Salpingoeca rosetta]|eukprot:XP_004995059.1 hypothetical protein PTSG_12138 [Salpingoeca rosetta]